MVCRPYERREVTWKQAQNAFSAKLITNKEVGEDQTPGPLKKGFERASQTVNVAAYPS